MESHQPSFWLHDVADSLGTICFDSVIVVPLFCPNEMLRRQWNVGISVGNSKAFRTDDVGFLLLNVFKSVESFLPRNRAGDRGENQDGEPDLVTFVASLFAHL